LLTTVSQDQEEIGKMAELFWVDIDETIAPRVVMPQQNTPSQLGIAALATVKSSD